MAFFFFFIPFLSISIRRPVRSTNELTRSVWRWRQPHFGVHSTHNNNLRFFVVHFHRAYLCIPRHLYDKIIVRKMCTAHGAAHTEHKNPERIFRFRAQTHNGISNCWKLKTFLAFFLHFQYSVQTWIVQIIQIMHIIVYAICGSGRKSQFSCQRQFCRLPIERKKKKILNSFLDYTTTKYVYKCIAHTYFN